MSEKNADASESEEVEGDNPSEGKPFSGFTRLTSLKEERSVVPETGYPLGNTKRCPVKWRRKLRTTLKT